MKSHIFTITAAALLVVGGAAGAATVVGSKHDLTTASGTAFSTTNNTADVCVFCHTPHGGSANGAPLWNRTNTATTFTMYDSAFSSTMDMTVAGSPQGVSAACLSCHDGTVAFDTLVNGATLASGTYNYNASGASQGYVFSGANSMAGRGAPVEFGANLTNQHPISVTYNTALDTAFNSAAAAEAAGVVFYGSAGDQVECGSCHNPHDSAVVPFLRVSNAASALCKACHVK